MDAYICKSMLFLCMYSACMSSTCMKKKTWAYRLQ